MNFIILDLKCIPLDSQKIIEIKINQLIQCNISKDTGFVFGVITSFLVY